VSLSTFEFVTGPKTDDWLVHMVGLLAAVIGSALLVAARRREGGRAIWTLAVGAALAFAAIDIVYASTGRIRWVYLLDATAELVLAGWLLAAVVRPRRGNA
jgi:hypothetical protein